MKFKKLAALLVALSAVAATTTLAACELYDGDNPPANEDVGGDTLPDEGGDTTPDEGETTPDEGETPDSGETTPDEGETTPDEGDPPDSGETTPDSGETTPDQGGNETPDGGETTPDQGETPDSGETTPDSGETTPDSGETTPDSGETPDQGETTPEEDVSVVVLTQPTIANSTVYIGQTLADVILTGGSANVDGAFTWSAPDTTITASELYEVTFTPSDTQIDSITSTVFVTATQLTVTVEAGANGTASQTGLLNVNYGDTLTVAFTPNDGYEIDTLTVDGVVITSAISYTLTDITQSHSIAVTFSQIPTDTENNEVLPFSLTCMEGTMNAYTYADNVLTFTEIAVNTVYSISGEFNGSIVFDVGDLYKFDLEMTGFTLTCDSVNPITILSGDEISLTAKKNTENFIYDNRAAIDATDTTLYSAAVYSLVDLEVCGKGALTIVSANNNGIHTKDDLQVKNLTISVTCVDNALKGNDSVEITSATTTLIAKKGDCIKTTNSHINETTLNQKGTVTITGGTHNLYAACDGIDAAYDVVIDDATTVLNIYTDKYSEYSEEVTAVSESTYYLRYTNTYYKYSVKYSNSSTGEILWVNASDSYETVTSSSNRPGGSGTTYYYYTFAKKADYDKLTVYMYSNTQTQGQDSDYYACSSSYSVNDSYDTVAVSYSSSGLSLSWTNYTTSLGGMGGGMQEGNSDKGDYSTKGIKASNAITIHEGTIYIQSYDDAIHANADVALENGATPLGNVTINGGNTIVYSNDDGVHADGTLTMAAGTLSVSHSYEGLEGSFIHIQGGSVAVVSSDDGFNGTSTTGNSIVISNGYVHVYATGDGIDSNSTTSNGGILFSGGTTVVICNANGNSAIDTERGYTHSGGYVIAIMTTGGMTSETSNGSSTGMTTKSSLSLSSGSYVTVTVNSTTVATVKMPCSMTAYVVYLGSSSATIASASTTSATLDVNGTYWNV